MLEYQLIRSKRRKTLGLQVKYGQVTVRAPYHVTSSFIDTFIQQKSVWLRAKIIEQQGEANFFDFCHASSLLFLGEKVTLNISYSKHAAVYLSDNSLIEGQLLSVKASAEQQLNVVISEKTQARLVGTLAIAKQVKKQLEKFFKQQADKLIIERLELISKQTSLTPINISIRQYRARWGSCNNRGEVSFNYLLMMTPLFVIDYVIVHELCHLEHLNHSKNFWQLVKSHSPRYEDAKQWLSCHQSQLHWKSLTK